MTPTRSSPSTTTKTETTETSGEDRVCYYYKGKHTNRSWQHLPPELVRSIATYHLLDLQSSNYTPLTWDAKELWHLRIVYTTLRDALDLERLMQVTPAWAAALETHLFWVKACTVIDPHAVLAHYSVLRSKPSQPGAPLPLHHQTPYRHFRQMTARSCYVCRINAPYTSAGLTNAKRTIEALNLGTIALCREHRKSTFCGLCLREAPPNECDPPHPLQQQSLLSALQASVPVQPFQTAFDVQTGAMRFVQQQQYPQQQHHQLPPHIQPTSAPTLPFNPAFLVCCAENEDDETWPGIETTCRSCRNEWLWQRISTSARDREALGGPRFGVAMSHPHARSRAQAAKAGRRRSDSSRSSHHPLDSDRDNNTSSITRFPPFKYSSPDWETRQTVDAFIDLGEGSISEVISVAREKFWLRKETKMVALMEQAIAATRWAGGEIGVDVGADVAVGSETGTREVVGHEQRGSADNSCTPSLRSHASSVYEEGAPHTASPNSRVSQAPRAVEYDRDQDPHSDVDAEELEEEEEEDPELLSLTEDAGGIRDLAISDWARTRILDGHWISPADQWYGYAWPAGGGVRDVGDETESEPDFEVSCGATVDVGTRVGGRRVRRVRAVHPCPWTVAPSTSNTSPLSEGALSAKPNANGDAKPNPNGEGSDGSRDDTEQDQEEGIHPRMSTVRSHAPPSFSLCEQAYRAYQKQLRDILLPAMVNLVRKIVVEATYGTGYWPPFNRTGGGERDSPGGKGRGLGAIVDPAVRVAKMGMEEVLEGLRQPGVWFEGYDWVGLALPSSKSSSLSSSPSVPAVTTKSGGETAKPEEREEDTNSSTSDRSASDSSSHTTSPVLSTTTLQTTPSPPPARGQAEKRGAKEKVIPPPRVPRPVILTQTTSTSASGSVTSTTGSDATPKTAPGTGIRTPKLPRLPPIPISPTLARPRLLHPIPYIPITLAYTPQFSLEAFRVVWREACAPLFHCRCSICERAIMNANASQNVGVNNTNTNSAPTHQQQEVPVQNVRPDVYQTQHHYQQQRCPPQVVLEELQLHSRPEVVAHEEEEEEEEYYEEEEEEEEEESEDEDEDEQEGDTNDSEAPSPAALYDHDREHAVTPRKRSCGDLEAESQMEEGTTVPRVGTPPKRARVGAVVVSAVPDVSSLTPLPTQNGKREVVSYPATAATASPRQRKRSSEELEVSGDGSGQTNSAPSANNADQMQMGSLQKRLRVEPTSATATGTGGRDRKTSIPRSLSTTPPSSVTAVSSNLSSSEEEGIGGGKKARGGAGYVDVSMQPGGGAGVVKTGLVLGGELDGLYVFEEV